MLDMFQMSDLWQYKDSMPDCKEKQLLNSLLFEYAEYAECGTPEDCKARLEWMTYSMEDVRTRVMSLAKGFQEEVRRIRNEAQPKPRKRGRPPKEEA